MISKLKESRVLWATLVPIPLIIYMYFFDFKHISKSGYLTHIIIWLLAIFTSTFYFYLYNDKIKKITILILVLVTLLFHSIYSKVFLFILLSLMFYDIHLIVPVNYQNMFQEFVYFIFPLIATNLIYGFISIKLSIWLTSKTESIFYKIKEKL